MVLVFSNSGCLPADAHHARLQRPYTSSSASDSSFSSASASTAAGHTSLDREYNSAAQPSTPVKEGRAGNHASKLQLRQSHTHSGWQIMYLQAAICLQRALQEEHFADSDCAMQAGQVYSMLRNLVQQRISEVKKGKIQQILSGSFLLEAQRMLLWCGGLRPSDLISCARIAMAADGMRLAPEADAQMTAVQDACLDHQASISRGIQDASERLARLRTMARYVRSQGPRDAAPVDLVPKTQVLKDSIAQLTMQADELRLQCMDQLAALLTPRQLSYYLLAPMDMLQLEE